MNAAIESGEGDPINIRNILYLFFIQVNYNLLLFYTVRGFNILQNAGNKVKNIFRGLSARALKV
jgi:nucleoside permease NupC